MIRTIYKELFTLSVRNLFYLNEQHIGLAGARVEEDFEVLPSKLTQEVMRQVGLVQCKITGGCKMMVPVNETAPAVFSPARKFDKTKRLVFFLRLRNGALMSFAEVAHRALPGGMCYYCNNRGINGDLRADLRLTIHRAVTATDDLMRLQLSRYTFEYPGLITASEAKVISVDGQEVVAPKSLVQQSGKTTLFFDLSFLSAGRYRLEITGIQKDEFYYADNQLDVFSVVEIFFDGTQPNYQVVQSDDSLSTARPRYTLWFERRKTFWRFIVNMNRNVLLLARVEISDGSTAFLADFPAADRAVFTSATTIDSSEEPLLRGSPQNLVKISLKDGLLEKIGNLPIPDLSVIKEESNQYYSEITINI
jgi:hypothetical protein